jgi:hypothetical protein
MRRVLLCCEGTFLGLAAGTILWNIPDLYLFRDSWHSAVDAKAALQRLTCRKVP